MEDFSTESLLQPREKGDGRWVSTRGPKGYENYKALQERRSEIETAFGRELEWESHMEKNRGTIFHGISGHDANQREDWPEQHDLLAGALLSLYRAIAPLIPALDAQEEDANDIPGEG